METDAPKIGDKIRKLRKAAGLSQAEVASEIGLTQPSLSRIEDSKTDVNTVLAHKIAQVLGVEITELFEG